jgi:gamma-D-glutamyl-L-lysine dipeptidyl-peptidase
MRHLLVFPLFFVLLCISCTTTDREDDILQEIIDRVQENYAPDRRIAVFDIEWERRQGNLIFKGEVDNPEAKYALFTAIADLDLPQPVDSIIVLPRPDLGEKQHALINVSVGNMRGHNRHSSELVTQVLLGTPVRVLKRQGGWYYVQSPDRYLGWINGGALHTVTRDELDEWNTAPQIIVTRKHGIVRQQPASNALPVTNVVIGSRLILNGRRGLWNEVRLPDGRAGYIENPITQNYATWRENLQLTGENIAETAGMFIGIPYLWGGTSVKGFDCSGFTKTVFMLNGLDLNRDASQQILMGKHIDTGENFSNLKKGDLVFFGRKETEDRPERIVHVGIYLGNGEFIHSSDYVRINSFFPWADNYDEFETNRFVRARRLINNFEIPIQ